MYTAIVLFFLSCAAGFSAWVWWEGKKGIPIMEEDSWQFQETDQNA